MDNTNIFVHSPKELTTDGFLTWLFYFLDSDVKYREEKSFLFTHLILKPEDAIREVEKIRVVRQYRTRSGRSDILLYFTWADNGCEELVLFENKIWTTTSDEQLGGYRASIPNAYEYIFLKLAYISQEEKEIAKSNGYKTLDCFNLASALKGTTQAHVIIAQYFEYITDTFCAPVSSYADCLFVKHDYSVLGDAGAQMYLIEHLQLSIGQQYPEVQTSINSDTSYGRPWTELNITEDQTINYQYTERLFWRVDCRSEHYYIRLNQYSQEGKSNWSIKKERLASLRKHAKEFFQTFGRNLKMGNLESRVSKESEVVIFFLYENDLPTLLKAICDYSHHIQSFYTSLNHTYEE